MIAWIRRKMRFEPEIGTLWTPRCSHRMEALIEDGDDLSNITNRVMEMTVHDIVQLIDVSHRKVKTKTVLAPGPAFHYKESMTVFSILKTGDPMLYRIAFGRVGMSWEEWWHSCFEPIG